MEKLNHYSIEEVIDTYQIVRIKNCQVLQDWLNVSYSDLKDHETELLRQLPQELEDWQYAWNEEELKMSFISPLLRIANINQKGLIGTFFERKLKGVVNGIAISVTCDCIVATPKLSGNPSMPYFFLQEYKRTKGDAHDPEGQMLAAMLLAQQINQDGKPLFGCWLQGKNWNFTVLNGLEYCVSHQFDATDPNALLQIVFILRKLKELILGRIV
jgi:hypothetical protein